jgi:murein DD-endopeptidase MepM/ murein hydrolase activator NlpD
MSPEYPMQLEVCMAVYRRRRKSYPIYVINKRKFVPFLVILFLLFVVSVLLYLNLAMSARQYAASQIDSDQLLTYFTVEGETGVPWYLLAAVDKAENIPPEETGKERSASIALHLTGIEDMDELPLFLSSYKDDKSFFRKVKKEAVHFEKLNEIFNNKAFPVLPDSEYVYENGYGDARTYGGERTHEGIDIMAEKGVPVLSVSGGVIEQVGWNELGGYRIGIRGEDNIYYYYAHLSRYEGKPLKGDKVKQRQLIGYVGDSGYGPEGTTGEFAPHLHFGMYYGKGRSLKAFNPYPFLKAWEKKN